MNKNETTVKLEAYDYHAFGECAQMKDSPLASTNYFRSDRADKGFFWLIRKCDNYHLLVPEIHEGQIGELLTGKYAHISHGTTRTVIVFEDFSVSPMILEFDNRQFLGMMNVFDKPKRKGFLAIYKLGQKHDDDIADEVTEVGRMDLWVNRTFTTDPYEIRRLTSEERNMYK